MTSLTDRLKVHLHSTRFSLLNFFLLRSLKSGNPCRANFLQTLASGTMSEKGVNPKSRFCKTGEDPPSFYFGAKTDREGEKSGECKLG